MTFTLWVLLIRQCANIILILVFGCLKNGVFPLHPVKLEGPFTYMTVLGIELDSILLQARLSQEKFDGIVALLDSWSTKRHFTRKDLESLIGHLQLDACKVVSPGHTFHIE